MRTTSTTDTPSTSTRPMRILDTSSDATTSEPSTTAAPTEESTVMYVNATSSSNINGATDDGSLDSFAEQRETDSAEQENVNDDNSNVDANVQPTTSNSEGQSGDLLSEGDDVFNKGTSTSTTLSSLDPDSDYVDGRLSDILPEFREAMPESIENNGDDNNDLNMPNSFPNDFANPGNSGNTGDDISRSDEDKGEGYNEDHSEDKRNNENNFVNKDTINNGNTIEPPANTQSVEYPDRVSDETNVNRQMEVIHGRSSIFDYDSTDDIVELGDYGDYGNYDSPGNAETGNIIRAGLTGASFAKAMLCIYQYPMFIKMVQNVHINDVF